ncbi:outer membrane protein assembly factor BamA [Maritalea mediterranea]|uniref:Outer membrane protein assembly factor BamA n=1 Tax=Maritalea mediterranea TaxID=2909667 RepID=A0ABS9E8M0_9HYPH|nr:outer membrane protein assembly factor BamA [Maritalea mediterranea]MCF4098557.1 outer membrane protein assembly factor BamA [Maritalea mediterranea]
MIVRAKLLPSFILGLFLIFGAPLMPGALNEVVGVEAAQAQTVSRISVTGNQRVDDSTVISFLAVRQGQRATPQLIDESIDSLYQSGLFSSVKVFMSGNTLNVQVTENPIISSVLFEGNQKFSDAQLSDMVNLSSRGVYTEAALQQDIRSIELAYDQAGFDNATVTARSEVQDNARVKVTFEINEGDRAGIAAIRFTGNNAISDGQLRAAIKTRESHLLSFLFRDDVYDEDKLNVDRELIRLYYANRGYPDAQVLSAVAEFDAERNAYFINFTIDEGEYYEFGNINIETSISGLNPDSLTGAVRTHEGRRYSLSNLQKSAAEMSKDAANMGYSFAEVRPRIDRNLENNTFNVTYLVDEGARLYVERINIFGNTRTRDFVIRREFEFAEGDPFNRTFLAAGREALMGLGFFSTVNVSVDQGSASDKVIVNVVVEEKSTGNYAIGANYSPDAGIGGELSLTERNFLGRGQDLRISVGATDGARTYDFSFTEPRFMGLRISAGVDAYRRETQEDKFYDYGTTKTGFRLRTGAPITDNLRASAFVGVEQTVFIDEDSSAPSYITALGSETTEISTGYGLTYTDVDDVRSPSEGYAFNFNQQYVGGDFNLLKTEAKASYYQPIMPDAGVVGILKGRGGIINALDGGYVNPTQTFVASSQIIRGFKGRGFGAQHSSGNALGMTEYLALTAEVEFPLPVLPENYGLKGAVWADAAYIGHDSIDPALIDSGIGVQTRTSIGASILWDSPFGPLRGDFAHVIDKDTADETQVFALTISTLF